MNTTDGRWHIFSRDLQADLHAAQPDARILAVNDILVGPMRIDDVQMMHANWDGDGLADLEEVNTFDTDPDVIDGDGDGLGDGEEIRFYLTDPLTPDLQ